MLSINDINSIEYNSEYKTFHTFTHNTHAHAFSQSVVTTFYWTQIKKQQHTSKREDDVFCKSSLTYHSHYVKILTEGQLERQ